MEPADIAPGSVPAFKRSCFHLLLDFLPQQEEQTSVQFSGLLRNVPSQHLLLLSLVANTHFLTLALVKTFYLLLVVNENSTHRDFLVVSISLCPQ